MKARLIDFMDPNRPLAKAALELDWTTVVALFPDASMDGLDAPRIWILASVLILGEITGLSESEVLARWPENPYWQAFSGFAQFQWKAPVSAADCLSFRRYVDVAKAARLSAIAQSILQTKTVQLNALEPLQSPTTTTVDDALALRQVHFLQPQPPQPYKAPPRPGFQSGIKQIYARSASPSASSPTSPSPAPPASPTAEPGSPTTAAPTEIGTPPKAPAALTAEVPGTSLGTASEAPLSEAVAAPIPEKPVVPQFAQTYSMLGKKAPIQGIRAHFPVMDGLAALDPSANLTPSVSLVTRQQIPPTAAPETPLPPTPTAPPRLTPTVTPVAPPTPTPGFSNPADPFSVQRSMPPGAPEFDTTAPFMRRVAPEEPVKMEVVVKGEGPLHYQWETFENINGAATPIEGCNEPSLTVALEESDSMLAFQCRVSNAVWPQGLVSRTFFLKKAARANPTTENAPQKATPTAAQPSKRR